MTPKNYYIDPNDTSLNVEHICVSLLLKKNSNWVQRRLTSRLNSCENIVSIQNEYIGEKKINILK